MNDEVDEIEIWELRRGSDLLATVEVIDQDFPWKYGRLSPSTEFNNVRHHFAVQGDRETVRKFLREQHVTLAPHGGTPVREFTLFVEGEDARFRFL